MQSVDIHMACQKFQMWAQAVAAVDRLCRLACYILEMVLAVFWMALWLVLESWVTGLPLCTDAHLERDVLHFSCNIFFHNNMAATINTCNKALPWGSERTHLQFGYSGLHLWMCL